MRTQCQFSYHGNNQPIHVHVYQYYIVIYSTWFIYIYIYINQLFYELCVYTNEMIDEGNSLCII